MGADFDGEDTTNGVHPRWQLYTAVLYAVSSLAGLGESAFLVGVFLSSLLLIVLATVTFTSDSARAVLRAVAIAGAAVTVTGVMWTINLTHEFGDAERELAARDEPVLVFDDPFLAREGGASRPCTV